MDRCAVPRDRSWCRSLQVAVAAVEEVVVEAGSALPLFLLVRYWNPELI